MGKFDTIFKEILFNSGKSLFEILFGLKIERFEPLPFDLPKIEQKITDFIAKISVSKQEKVLHFEFQTYNDSDLPFRMLRYKSEIMRTYRLQVIQIVIYIGKENLNMQDSVCEKDDRGLSRLDYKFTIIDLSSEEPDIFIRSDIPELLVLSILCRIEEASKTEVMRKVLGKLKELAPKKKFDYYIAIVETLCEIRDLREIFDKEVRNMGLEIDYKESFIYKEGKIEGIKEGLYDAIAVGIETKFGKRSLSLMKKIRKIRDIQKLKTLQKEVIKATKYQDFLKFLNNSR